MAFNIKDFVTQALVKIKSTPDGSNGEVAHHHVDSSALPAGASTAAKQDALAVLVGEVQASPTANTLLDRLKSIATTLAANSPGAATGVVGGTGGVSSNQITVSAISTGSLAYGSRVQGTGISSVDYVYVTGQVSGTAGGAGVYSLSKAVTVAAGTSLTTGGAIAIQTTSALVAGDIYVVDPQSSAAGANSNVIVQSVSGSGPYTALLKSVMPLAHAAGAAVVGAHTPDGTHLTPQAARAEAVVIDPAKAALRG